MEREVDVANLTILSLDDPVDASLSSINGNFSALNTELTDKAAALHTHDASAIVSGVVPAVRLGSGGATSATFLRGDSQWQQVQWQDVGGKPTSFPPEAHGHDGSDIVAGVIGTARLGGGTPAAWKYLRGDQIWTEVDWSHIVNKPSTFAPSSHSHAPSDLTQAGAQAGQALLWSGAQWAPGTVATGDSPTPYEARAASFTAASNKRYRLTANSIMVTLPAAPADGDWVELIGSVTGCSVARNGKTIMGLAEDLDMNISHFAVRLVYIAASGDWRLTI